jgi:hypothetical protein
MLIDPTTATVTLLISAGSAASSSDTIQPGTSTGCTFLEAMHTVQTSTARRSVTYAINNNFLQISSAIAAISPHIAPGVRGRTIHTNRNSSKTEGTIKSAM